MECMALFRTLHYNVAVLSAVLCLAQCILISSILTGKNPTHLYSILPSVLKEWTMA